MEGGDATGGPGDECKRSGGVLQPGAVQSREGCSYCKGSGAQEGGSGKETSQPFLPPSDLWSLLSQLKREPGWLSARLSLRGREQGSEGWRIAGREADREPPAHRESLWALVCKIGW